MSNLTIFKNPGAVTVNSLPKSAMAEQIASTMGGFNRIATSTNGTFKRIVNGEQVGKAIRGEFNAIIVAMLAKPGREFYSTNYDPDAKPTLPDCWSNLGDKPEANVPNRQAANCASCSMNIDGSGQNGKGKACRFKRKIAIMLEGDSSGDVYQFNVPAKSLFGKGEGNTHPYESYTRFLVANGTSPDRVVTTIAYNLEAETMELTFAADRYINEDELELVNAAQNNSATQRLIQITASEVDGAKQSAPKAPIAEPKPAAKQSFLSSDDEEEEEEAPKAKRAAKKSATAEVPKVNSDLASIVNAWEDDEED